MSVSIIIPAFNEEKFLPNTLTALDQSRFWDELIVVDDGSQDGTARISLPRGARLIRHGKNRGKAKAIMTGIAESRGKILLLLDADLEESVSFVEPLVIPVQRGMADMTVAKFPPAGKAGGFGIVKKIARAGIGRMTGFFPDEPLSGQRCLRREVAGVFTGYDGLGFGLEVAMTLDVLRAGYRIQEIELPLRHRVTGRTWKGFCHRGRELKDIVRTFWEKGRR